MRQEALPSCARDGDASPLPTRAIVIASGVEYRRPRSRETCRRFEGAGV